MVIEKKKKETHVTERERERLAPDASGLYADAIQPMSIHLSLDQAHDIQL